MQNRELEPDLCDNALSLSQEAQLADVATFTDWLADECFKASPSVAYFPNDALLVQSQTESASIPELVARSHSPFERIAMSALMRLRELYLTAHADVIAARARVIEEELLEAAESERSEWEAA